MNYSCFYSSEHNRWHGTDVPAECDYYGCREDIERGPSFLCMGSGCDCGLFFCYTHQGYRHDEYSIDTKEDSEEWLTLIVTSPDWEDFRQRYPDKIREYRETIE